MNLKKKKEDTAELIVMNYCFIYIYIGIQDENGRYYYMLWSIIGANYLILTKKGIHRQNVLSPLINWVYITLRILKTLIKKFVK